MTTRTYHAHATVGYYHTVTRLDTRVTTKRDPSTDNDSHSWQYHYVKGICEELAKNDETRTKEIFERMKSQALSDLQRAGLIGNAGTGLLLNAIAKIAGRQLSLVDKYMSIAPARGDSSRDIESIYDGTSIDEIDYLTEQESTLFVKYLAENNSDIRKFKRTVCVEMLQGYVELPRADVARGKKKNGVMPHSRLRLFSTLRVD